MSDIQHYKIIDGIKCFSPEAANDYADYPDSGFDLTDKNGETSFWVRSRNRLFKNIIQRQLLPNGKTRLLEVGCGTGNFIQHLVQNKRLEITGSEIYLKGLVYAKKNLPSVNFVQYDVTQGKIDEQFDIVAAFDVLEHIENDNAALFNINQMLNKGGVAIISVPQHMFMWGPLDEIVKHKRRYSKKELVKKLENNGFDINICTSFVFFLFPLMIVSRFFDKQRDKSKTEEQELEKRVKFPKVMNWIFDLFMRMDEALIKKGFSLPFGGTLVVVAKKY